MATNRVHYFDRSHCERGPGSVTGGKRESYNSNTRTMIYIYTYIYVFFTFNNMYITTAEPSLLFYRILLLLLLFGIIIIIIIVAIICIPII